MALGALTAGAAAVVVSVASVHTTHGVTQAQASQALSQLDGANKALSDQLHALRRGHSPRPAQQANRSAAALARQLSDQVGSSGTIGAAVHAVLAAELAYNDAVGSTINNPRSVLLDKVVPRSDALRKAIDDAPSGNVGDVTGADLLVAFSNARAAG